MAKDLRERSQSLPHQLLLQNLSKRLEDHLAVTEKAAQWAVESWALALGVTLSHSILIKQGNKYCIAGNYEKASEAYQEAIRLQPHFSQAYLYLGYAYGQLGYHEKAAEAYQQLIRWDPDNAVAHHDLGVTYAGLGRWQEAVQTYQEAIRLKPEFTRAHYNLGVAYGQLGHRMRNCGLTRRRFGSSQTIPGPLQPGSTIMAASAT